MKRKVVQLAHRTLVVSLPHKWADKYGIKKGDEVEVEQYERELSIKTSAGVAVGKKLTIELKGQPEIVKRYINVAYKRGYDEIEASFDDPEVMGWVEEEMDTLLGFEIIDQGEHYCAIKSISSGLEQEFDSILRRIFRIMLEMASNMEEAVAKKEFERLTEIAKAEKMNNKLTNFCKRLVNKKGFHEQKDSNLIYCIVWGVEQLADEYRDICNYLAAEKKGVTKDTLELFKRANELLKEFYEMFYNYKDETASKFSGHMKKFKKEMYGKLHHKERQDTVVRSHVYNIAVRTNDIAGPALASKI